MSAVNDGVGSADFFRQGGVEFLRDAWLAAEFDRHCSRAASGDERWKCMIDGIVGPTAMLPSPGSEAKDYCVGPLKWERPRQRSRTSVKAPAKQAYLPT